MTRDGVCERVVKAVGVRGILTVWGMVFVAATGVAQRTDTGRFAVENAQERQVAEESLVLPVRTVTVALEKVALAKAVDVIAEKANVRIQYRANMLDRVATPVSVRVVEASLEEVLEKVLAGTGLYAIRSAQDAVTIKAQDVEAQGGISGIVLHAKTKQPISRATIVLDDATQEMVTGADGKFHFSVAPGEHRVSVRSLGMVRQHKSTFVKENEVVTLEFVLEPSASVLDEVIVTGTVVETERRAISTPITVITAADIEQRGITHIEQLFRGDIPEVVAQEQGAQASVQTLMGTHVRSNLYARGASGTSTGLAKTNPLKVYIDGIELADPELLGTIDMQSIERIEVITGPQASTIYGSGSLGGVMQIFTKKGSGRSTPEYRMTSRYGMMENSFSQGRTPTHNHNAEMSGGDAKTTYALSASYDYQGQWQPMLWSQGYGASLGATYKLGPLAITSSTGVTSRNSGTSGCVNEGAYGLSRDKGKFSGEEMRDFSCVPNQQVNRAITKNLSLRIESRPLSFLGYALTIGQNAMDMKLDPVAPRFRAPSDTAFNTDVANQSRTNISINVNLVKGLGILQNTMSLGMDGASGEMTRVIGCINKLNGGTRYDNCMGTGGPSGIRSNNDWNYGGFLNYQLGVADQFFLTAAVRAQHSPKYGQDYKWDFTPKFGSSIILDFFDLTTKLSVSYGKATRVPPDQAILGQLRRNINTVPGEYYDIRPNNLIRPEKSVGTEGTLEVYAGSWGSLTINHYVQQIRDLINAPRVDSLYLQYPADPDRNTWVPVSQWRNVEAVKQVGWSGTGSLEAGSLSLRGTWSWSRSRTKYSPYDQLVNQEPVNLPSHYHSGSVSYAVGTTSVSLNAYYTGSSRRQYYYQENIQSSSRARLPMYRDIAQITWNNGYTYFGAPGYVKFDLNAMKRLRSWVDATIHVNNVGNSFASDRGSALPSLGRKTTLGFTIRHR